MVIGLTLSVSAQRDGKKPPPKGDPPVVTPQPKSPPSGDAPAPAPKKPSKPTYAVLTAKYEDSDLA